MRATSRSKVVLLDTFYRVFFRLLLDVVDTPGVVAEALIHPLRKPLLFTEIPDYVLEDLLQCLHGLLEIVDRLHEPPGAKYHTADADKRDEQGEQRGNVIQVYIQWFIPL